MKHPYCVCCGVSCGSPRHPPRFLLCWPCNRKLEDNCDRGRVAKAAHSKCVGKPFPGSTPGGRACSRAVVG